MEAGFLPRLPKDSNSGLFCAAADAFATARETASTAFAPRRDLFGVPSNAIKSTIKALLIRAHPSPRTVFAISTLMLAIKLFRQSYHEISWDPDRATPTLHTVPWTAPDGTSPCPFTPFSRTTSASMVGIPAGIENLECRDIANVHRRSCICFAYSAKTLNQRAASLCKVNSSSDSTANTKSRIKVFFKFVV